MSTSVDSYRPPPNRRPLREPIPALQQHQPHQQRLQPLTQIVPDQRPHSQYSPQPSHAHTRNASSGIFPSESTMPPSQQPYGAMAPHHSQPQYQQQYTSQYPPTTRRTLSNATTSTTSTNGGNRKQSLVGPSLQRTTSSRSGNSPISYVALMRKQKATVWSDRAQHEDPRLIAQQRAAKVRAHMEVSFAHNGSGRASTSGNSSNTGGVRSMIRTHGVGKPQTYAPTANLASGVPMRLSAREVDEDDDDHMGGRNTHQRSGSGRSSVGSNGRVASMYGPGGATGRSSEGSTPPQHSSSSAPPPEQRGRADTQGSVISTTAEPTPVPDHFRGTDYFAGPRRDAESTPGSDNSERENSFGNVPGLPHRVRQVEEKKDEDLQRRGSVDERTTTMRGFGRLFVANPDLSD